MSALSPARLFRWPARRVTIRVLAVALLLAAICWYFGADLWQSILFGTVITIAALITFLDIDGDVRDADWRSKERADRFGYRSDVASLSWSLRASYGRVGRTAMWRVRRLGQQRLARYHLNLSDPTDRPAIEQLIGRRAYLILARPERRPPLLSSLLRCLDALDALGPDLDPTPPEENP